MSKLHPVLNLCREDLISWIVESGFYKSDSVEEKKAREIIEKMTEKQVKDFAWMVGEKMIEANLLFDWVTEGFDYEFMTDEKGDRKFTGHTIPSEKNYGKWGEKHERIVYKDEDFIIVKCPGNTKTKFCYQVVPIQPGTVARLDDYEICPEPDTFEKAVELMTRNREDVQQWKKGNL